MVFENYIHNDVIRTIVIFMILLISLRIIVSILERIILKLVKKTKTDLDDIIIKRSSVPITILIMFFSLLISIKELQVSSNLLNNINNFIYSGIAIFIGYLIYVIVDVSIFKVWTKIAKKAKIDIGESIASLIQGVLKIIIIIISILYILDLWGFQITPLLAGLGLAGLAIALALQPVLGNIFSGISIIMDKSVRIGDLVYLDNKTKGQIMKIGLRSTRINTFDNELIIIPNTKLAESVIQNVSLPEPKTRVVVPFGVAYGSDVDKVKEIVLKELKTIKNVSKDPEPLVRFLEMADSSLNFKAYFYVEHFNERFIAIDEANTKIYKSLNKNNIHIPFPQLDVHLKK